MYVFDIQRYSAIICSESKVPKDTIYYFFLAKT